MSGYILGIIIGTILITASATYLITSKSIEQRQSELKRYEEEQKEKQLKQQIEWKELEKEREKENKAKFYKDISRIEKLLFSTDHFNKSLDLYNTLNNIDNGFDFWGISEDDDILKKDLEFAIKNSKGQNNV